VDTILEEMPEIAKIARIEVVDYSRTFSQHLTLKNELNIARIATEQLARKEVTGVLITVGSNTSDETAYFMSLLVRNDKPLVIVAAQRGLVDNDRIVLYYRPLTRHTTRSEFDFQKISAGPLPAVNIVHSYLDADAFIIDALVKQKRVAGIVLAGFLTGNVTLAQEDAMTRAREAGVAVVMSTRGWGGRVSSTTTPERLGADNLSPEKARILLMMALTVTKESMELRRIFN
jgi:L-asparaginase/Glu-tRNA(Gln) amidotransferase subunit D